MRWWTCCLPTIAAAGGEGRGWHQDLVCRHGHKNWINRLQFSPDATLLATTSDDRTARIFSRDSGESLLVIRSSGVVLPIRFMNNGTSIAVGDDRTVKLYPIDFSLRDLGARNLLESAETDSGMRLDGFALVPRGAN